FKPADLRANHHQKCLEKFSYVFKRLVGGYAKRLKLEPRSKDDEKKKGFEVRRESRKECERKYERRRE
ncbi:MAG: hypothetical protein KJ771_05585, partial [Nanoarchaeota archaeon]|nr:hypothetical protein [Nanoarchaeota archaeon]